MTAKLDAPPGDGAPAEVYSAGKLGRGYSVLEDTTVALDVARAEELLDLKEFEAERALDADHVSYLERCMVRGDFLPEQVTLAICKLGRSTYRVNGQHTCCARLQVEKREDRKDYNFQVRLVVYQAKNEQGLRELYATFDRGKARSRNVVTNAFLFEAGSFVGMKKGTLAIAPLGFAMWLWEDAAERRRHDPDEIALRIRDDYQATAAHVCCFLDELRLSECGHVMNKSVVAAMFATFDRSPRIAKQFWTRVATGVDIARGDSPEKKLLDRLGKISFRPTFERKDVVSPEEAYRICIAAWNAFRAGHSVNGAFRVDLEAPRPTAAK